jgi:hypothetical protein
MDAKAARRSQSDAYGQAVWSWRPDAGVKFVDDFSRATVANTPAHRLLNAHIFLGCEARRGLIP